MKQHVGKEWINRQKLAQNKLAQKFQNFSPLNILILSQTLTQIIKHIRYLIHVLQMIELGKYRGILSPLYWRNRIKPHRIKSGQ